MQPESGSRLSVNPDLDPKQRFKCYDKINVYMMPFVQVTVYHRLKMEVDLQSLFWLHVR
jgi:hypothetical protein